MRYNRITDVVRARTSPNTNCFGSIGLAPPPGPCYSASWHCHVANFDFYLDANCSLGATGVVTARAAVVRIERTLSRQRRIAADGLRGARARSLLRCPKTISRRRQQHAPRALFVAICFDACLLMRTVVVGCMHRACFSQRFIRDWCMTMQQRSRCFVRWETWRGLYRCVH